MKCFACWRVFLALFALCVAVPGARAATDTYATSATNMNTLVTEKNFSPPYAGTYDNGSELAQYANSGSFGNTPGAAAFRTLTVSGGHRGAAARTLRVGDTFTITAYAGSNPSAGGYIGLSFRDSTDYADFFKATDATTEARFQLDNTGGWKLYRNGGSDDSGLGSGADRTFTISITSANTFNATIGNVTYYDVDMAAAGGTIDSIAFYTYGDSNPNSFWKNATLDNTGVVLLGAGNATKTISGAIDDGRLATSASTVSPNLVIKTGTGAITLSVNETYTGGTIISNGTLIISGSCRPGTNTITVQTNAALKFARSDTFGGNGTDFNQMFLVNGGAITNQPGAFNTMGPITLDGGAIGSDGGNQAAWPSFYLRKTVTVLPNANPSRITSSGGTSGDIVLSTNTIFDVANGAAAQDLVVPANLRNANGVSGACLTKMGDGVMLLSGTNSYSGSTYVYGGTLLHDATNLSASTFVASNAVLGGVGRVQTLTVNGGTLSPGNAGRGTLTAGGAATWAGGSAYRWEVSDFSGTPGAATGWDLVKGLGALTISATAGNEFTVRVVSVTAGGAAGDAANFTDGASTQIIANAQSISGFATNAFAIDLSGFSNPHGGTFNIAQVGGTNIALVYVPQPPDAAVLGVNGAEIANGEAVTSTAAGTDFGSLDLTSSGATKTFTLTNAASGILHLTGSPAVQIGGANPADFTVTAQPSTTLTGHTKTTFSIRFTPKATGLRQAVVSIASDDPDEDPYTFTVEGSGTFNASAFPSKVQIQFCGYNRGESLTNFPALVVLGSGVTNFSYDLFLNAAGSDLRFTDGGQTRFLNHEVDVWNTNGNSYLWVQVPVLAGNTTTVWAMWGNASAASAPEYTTNGATWSESYIGVWHLDEASGTFGDSVSTNSGTLIDVNSSTVRGTNSLIGRGVRLVGGEADVIQIANQANFDRFSNITVMAWAKELNGDAWAPWVSKNGESGGYGLRRRGAGSASASPDWVTRGTTATEQNNSLVDGTAWHFLAGSLDQGATKTKRLFIDGLVDKEDLVTGAISHNDDNLLFGGRTNSAAYWGGILDEVRISSVARSTNWVWAEYQTSASNALFNCYGAVSGGPEMDVRGTNMGAIADGTLSTSTTLGTDFGTVTLSTGSRADRVFTITNAGNATLTLSGSPLVNISGAGALDYSVISGPTRTNLTAGQTATFTLRFLPNATGTRAATVSIGSNDGDENPYDFAITGAGSFSPAAYTYQLPLQFCGYDRGETLTNFPVLVKLGPGSVPGFSYGQLASPSGGDLRFTDSTQTQLLNFEIESWDTGGNSYVWVQVPALSGTNTSIYAYWGNTNAATLPSYATNGAAWSERYAGVWHLAETAGTSRDSTANGLSGYPSNGVTQAAGGQVGDADDFGGSGSRTFIGTPAVLNSLTNNFTVSAWIRPDALGGNRVIFGAHWGSLDGWSLRLAGPNLAIERLPGGALTPGVAVTAGQWAAVSVAYDTANNASFYINGSLVGTVAGTTPAAPSTQPWSIGANTGDNFDGIIDEVQVSQAVRSSNWLWAAYQNTASNSSFTCAGALQGPGALGVLGTNGAPIASGSVTVSEADGTDFGLVPVSSYREHTFRLTNSGVGTLTISGVTTSGTHKANFSVRSFPATISGLSVSNLVIRFTPPGSGSRTATVTVVSSDDTSPNYTFKLVGSDSSAGIGVGPTNIPLSGSLGEGFTNTFSVTNIGSISQTYSFTSDVGWITSPEAGQVFTNGALVSRSHDLAIVFTNPLCSPGVYTGRVYITAPVATNSPRVVAVVATVAGPAQPTSVSATAAGQELVRLAWQPAGGNPVMIVYSEGAPASDPPGCAAYSVGASGGGGTVLYLGSGSSLEHTVRTNATHHYRFYSVQDGVYYSTAVTAAPVSTAYGYGLLVAESFAYTNSLALGGRNGGLGWTNAWSVGNSYLIATSSLTSASGFTGGAGNSATNVAGSQSLRGIAPITAASGKLYLAFQLKYVGAGFAGISMFDGGDEQLFIGQRSAAHEFGIVYYGGNAGSSGANSMKTNVEYTVVAVLDLANGTASASYYTNATQTIPAVEPAVWQVNTTGPTTSVWNRIRLGSGVGAAFDEIRIGRSWRDVMDSAPYTLAVDPSSLVFHVTAGAASSNIAFQVANGTAASYGYTNTISYGSGASGWLNLSSTSGALTAFSAVTHTAQVSALGGASGSYVATNRIVSSQGTATQVITVVLSGVPTPTDAAVVADGPELRRLSWTESGNRDVMIIHRAGSAPAADPVQGVSYTVGQTIPGSSATVVYIGTNGFLEHVGAAGSAPYYKFFSISGGSYYSTGALVSAAAQSYPAGVILDQSAATQSVALATVASGQGWSGAWSVSDAAGSFTIATNTGAGVPSFATLAGFPTSFAHRIKMSNQGNGGGGTALRTFSAISAGRVYVSYLVSYQYPGAQKYAGLSLMSSGTEKAFIGETSGADGYLGVDSYGGSGAFNSGFELDSYQEGITNVYLVIGAYDFATRELKTVAYRAHETVPASEPSVWTLSTNLPAGRITSINGIRLAAGCADGLNSVGDVFFDEVRVARSWAGLVQQTGPVLSSYSLNNGAGVTDAQMTNGAWGVTMNFYDPAGMAGSPLDFDLIDSNATELASDVAFSAQTFTANGTRLAASNGIPVAVTGSGLYLGPYYLRWSAFNSNGVGAVNSTADTNNNSVSFTVADDDAAGPVASGFNVSGQQYTNVDLLGGLLVTGLIQDAGSGLYGGASNRYVLYRNGSQVAAGPFDTAPGADGAAQASAEPLAVALPGSVVTNVGNYTFTVLAWDVDNDRPGDSARGSNSFFFSVAYFGCPAGLAPIIAPLTDKSTTSNVLLSFTVSASDIGCDVPSLSVTGLPAGASFNTAPSGTNQVGTFSWTPQTVGTFPVMFTADDGTLSTSRIIRIYVGAAGEPANGQGVPVSQTNWHVSITNLLVPSSGNATLVWSSVSGIPYDIYSSAQPIGGGASWTKVVASQDAEGNLSSAAVAAVTSMRFFQVVPEGYAPSERGVWGAVKPVLQPGFNLLSAPVNLTAEERSFDGELGTVLAAVLNGSNTGTGDGNGDEVFILNPDGSYSNLYLNASGVWKNSNGTDSHNTLQPGQGFIVLRNTASTATPIFTGPVGNTSTATNSLAPGFSIIGLSEGKALTLTEAFANPTQGTPHGNYDQTQADLIYMIASDGSYIHLQRLPDGAWFNLSTFTTATNKFTPGSAMWYYRTPAQGTLKVKF